MPDVAGNGVVVQTRSAEEGGLWVQPGSIVEVLGSGTGTEPPSRVASWATHSFTRGLGRNVMGEDLPVCRQLLEL